MDVINAQQRLTELGLSPTAWTNVVVVEAAIRRGIEVFRRGESTQIYFRNKAGRVHRWRGGSNSLNTRLANRVTRHKQVANALLRAQGVAATENATFSRDDLYRAWAWGSKFDALVLKPTDATHGADVFVNVVGLEEFTRAFTRIAGRRSGLVLVEEFCQGTEHRCLVVKNRLVAATRRRPASVMGDGFKTIAELVNDKNNDRGVIHKPLKIGPIARQELERNGYTPASIPKQGERVFLRRTTNIHTGGDAIDATDTLSEREVHQIEEAARAIPGAVVVGLDVLIDHGAPEGDVRIIEMNLAPMISMHHFPWEGEPRNVADAIIDAMYPETVGGD